MYRDLFHMNLFNEGLFSNNIEFKEIEINRGIIQ